MARKSKSLQADIRVLPAVTALVLCLVLGGAGVGYVWQQNQLYELGVQLGDAQVSLEKMERQNKKLADQLAFLSSPRELDAQIKKRNLGLVPPNQEQIVRLTEAATGRTTNDTLVLSAR